MLLTAGGTQRLCPVALSIIISLARQYLNWYHAQAQTAAGGIVPQQHGQHGGFQPQGRAPYAGSMRSAPVQSYREERSPSPPPRERSRRGASKRVVYKEDFDRCFGRLVVHSSAGESQHDVCT